MSKNSNYSIVTEQIVLSGNGGKRTGQWVMFTVWTVVSFEAHTCQPLLSVHCTHCVPISLSKAVSIFYTKKSRWVKNLKWDSKPVQTQDTDEDTQHRKRYLYKYKP